MISDNLRGALYMNVAMAAFTLNDTAMKAVTETLPLYQSIGLRGALTLIPLVLIAHFTGGLRLSLGPRDRVVVAIRCVAEVGGTLLFLAALMHMPLANLSAILQSLPLAVTLAAALFFGERVGWRRMSAIVVGFIGVLIIIRPGPDGFDFWSLIGLASVACVVVRDLSTREISRGVPSATVAVLASVTVTAAGFALSAGQGWQPIGGHQALLLGAAASALVVGYMFSVMVMRVGDIGFIAPFRYTALLWAIVLGWLAFGNLPDGLTLAGAGLVVGSGVFTLWRERRIRKASA
jgi:drug/metabolite transporter (DMT)-like permease